MEKLSVETFLTGTRDMESRQLHILQGVKNCYDEFSRTRLYPTLAELTALYGALQEIVSQSDSIKGRMPQRLKEIDLTSRQLVYEQMQPGGADLEQAIDLIQWALPLIKRAIDEGANIYNFVDEHIQIEHVGLMPMYRDEGYWFVPDPKSALLHLLRYEVSLFTSASERYRMLKTKLLESIEQEMVRLSPESIKLRLMGKYSDLPNPATFVCDTDLEFPYTETILPIAKRKLLAQVTA